MIRESNLVVMKAETSHGCLDGNHTATCTFFQTNLFIKEKTENFGIPAHWFWIENKK